MSVVLFRRKGASVKAPIEEDPVLSKKDQAFELFNQGKTLDDPEVQALGLKPDSAKKYYRLWKQE